MNIPRSRFIRKNDGETSPTEANLLFLNYLDIRSIKTTS